MLLTYGSSSGISESLFWTDRKGVTNEGFRRRLYVYDGSL